MMSGRFTLEDFLVAMSQIQKMGPLDQLMKLIPGANKMKIPAANMDPKRFRHVEAIILSMTLEERRNPKILNGSRRGSDREGQRPPGIRGEPSHEAVQGNAEIHEADARYDGRHGRWWRSSRHAARCRSGDSEQAPTGGVTEPPSLYRPCGRFYCLRLPFFRVRPETGASARPSLHRQKHHRLKRCLHVFASAAWAGRRSPITGSSWPIALRRATVVSSTTLGYYKPLANPARLVIDLERVDYWISEGASPSRTHDVAHRQSPQGWR